MRHSTTSFGTVLCFATLSTLAGCGGSAPSVGGGGGGGNPLDFSLQIPSAITVPVGSTQNLSVQVVGQNGFSDSVTITVNGLPSGVTVSPPSLVEASGNQGTFQFSASSNAAAGQTQLTMQGVSGSTKKTSNLTLTITVAPVSQPFTTIGGWIQRAYFDETRQLLFATNATLNELDVLSGTDLTIRNRVPLPQPVGIDQMPDGKTLVVGTLTQGLYLVDEDTLAVTQQLAPQFPGTPPIAAMLQFPVAMANGKVLIAAQDDGFYLFPLAQYQGNGGNYLIQWDSHTNIFTNITKTVMPNAIGGLRGIKRSADHKWAIFQGDLLYIYSSDADTYASGQLPGGAQFQDGAVNHDGTQFAVAAFSGTSGEQVIFLDRSLNPLGTVNTTVGTWYNGTIMYSTDDSRLYAQLGIFEAIIDVIDPKKFVETGSAATVHLGLSSEGFLWVDSKQRAFLAGGGWSSGVGLLDCTKLKTGPPQSVNGTNFTPAAILLGASTPVSLPNGFNMPPGSVVTFNGIPAGIQSYNPFTVVPPPNPSAEPVNTQFTLPDGGGSVGPLNFSYGANAVATPATLLSSQGNSRISIYGFGLFDTSALANPTPPTITIGGKSGSNVIVNTTPNVVQQVSVQIPSGNPGPADISVTSSYGTSTLKGALTYIPSATIVPASGLVQLLYDKGRNLLFALKNSEVDVLNPATLQWETPLRPGGYTGAGFASMALTPDGTRLLVVDSANSTLTIFNPDSPAQSIVIALPIPPKRVIATSIGTAYIATGNYAIECDLLALTCTQQKNGLYIQQAWLAGTPDGKHIVTCCNFRGSVGVWNAANDTFSAQQNFYLQTGNWTDLVISPDGSVFVALYELPGFSGVLGAFFDEQLHFLNALVYPDLAYPDGVPCLGAMFSASGKTLLVPLGDSIDFTDTATGKLRGRLMTAEFLPVINYPITWSGNLAMDPTEQTIYAISASGLTVFKLPMPVDQVQPPIWPY
jgi:hypothetical protein